jgi:hypothetical protein
VSNIITEFLRIQAWTGSSISPDEASWIVSRLLADRGSYYVPVAARLAPDRRHVDIQWGSAKSLGLIAFWDEYGDQYSGLWTRQFDPSYPWDIIWRGDPNGRDARSCRYAFDEVRVTGARPGEDWEPYGSGVWRLAVSGSYLTCNSRVQVSERSGGLVTPTTPCYDDVAFEVLEPAGLERCWDAAARVEFRWRGRLVHRAQEEYDAFLGRRQWEHRSADDWDNCADERFLASA